MEYESVKTGKTVPRKTVMDRKTVQIANLNVVMIFPM